MRLLSRPLVKATVSVYLAYSSVWKSRLSLLKMSLSTAATPSQQALSLYQQLITKLKDIERLEGIRGLVQWDSEVMMKPGSFPARNNQLSSLAAVIYEKQTHAELGQIIEQLSRHDLSSLSSDFERANVRDAKRDYETTVRKSKDMAVRLAELEGQGYQVWVKAREDDRFEDFAPVLSDLIALKKKIVGVTHPHLSAYDGNIDAYERGMSTERLREIFAAAKNKIVPLIQSIAEANKANPYVVPQPLRGGDDWDVAQQRVLCTSIAQNIGFDFDKGRLDVSVHPFTGGAHPTDVRITTRYSSGNWLEGVSGTVHEVGHALYEQGRNNHPDFDDTPVSRALSMGVHESQSLLWERMIFQSVEFWQWLTPILQQHFPHTSGLTTEQFYRFVNQVEPGLIRIEADEVTYPLHIILRFELEQGLFDGTVSVQELPEKWKTMMKNTLGVTVPSDTLGVLQDVHWSGGAFGYFPSYTLGAMIAAQLFETAVAKIPNLRGKISRGEFSELREWLRVNVHQKGSLYASPDELLTAVTGGPLDPSIYVNYLTNKYSALYGLKL